MKLFTPLFLLFLFGCGPSRPDPKDRLALIKEDDSLRASNTKIYAEIGAKTQGYEDYIDTVPPDPNLKRVRILKVKGYTNEIKHYLQNIQVELLIDLDGIAREQATMMKLKDLEHPRNTDITFHYLIGDDAKHPIGKSTDIKTKINNYNTLVKELIAANSGSVEKIMINTSDVTTEYDHELKTWEAATFDGLNAAEAIVALDKLQNEILKVGNEAIIAIQNSEEKSSPTK